MSHVVVFFNILSGIAAALALFALVTTTAFHLQPTSRMTLAERYGCWILVWLPILVVSTAWLGAQLVVA